jgi:hypothetical protein
MSFSEALILPTRHNSRELPHQPPSCKGAGSAPHLFRRRARHSTEFAEELARRGKVFGLECISLAALLGVAIQPSPICTIGTCTDQPWPSSDTKELVERLLVST